MKTVDVLNLNKEKKGSVQLSEEVYGKPLRKDILQQVVRWQLACRRQGTASTKTKGLVSGGGKKPFKQKGTGNARQGSTRSILNPGGGTAFGPTPRDYSYALPKTVRQAGLKVALSYLVANDKFFVVDELTAKGKTKALLTSLNKFGVNKAVLLDSTHNESLERAARNLTDFRYYSVEGLNVYDLLKYDAVVVTKAALEGINIKCGVRG
jgi:large subunit ribosomal protein L4